MLYAGTKPFIGLTIQSVCLFGGISVALAHPNSHDTETTGWSIDLA